MTTQQNLFFIWLAKIKFNLLWELNLFNKLSNTIYNMVSNSAIIAVSTVPAENVIFYCKFVLYPNLTYIIKSICMFKTFMILFFYLFYL